MNRARTNPFYTGLITALVLIALMVGVVISGIPAGPQIPVPWNQKMTLNVQLANADALAPHASVEIAGVKVGEVESVNAQGNLAVAALQIQQQYSDIHQNATVYLRAHGLFGPKYIAIVPGTASSPELHDGDTITVNQTVQPVDLDAILQDLQAPEQQNLRTVFVELGEAAAGKGSDVNHLIAAADNLSQALQTPLTSIDSVGPNLSDMLVKDEQFNNYFAQTPLDQLVANSEQTVQAFAANASHLESLLVHADSSLTTLDTALNGQPGNLAAIIQTIGQKGGTIDKLDKFTYLLGLFGANLTGKEGATDPADQDVTGGIIGAVSNVASAFFYGDACPTAAHSSAVNDNHCSVSPDKKQHFLHVRSFNVTPPGPSTPSQQICLPVPTIPGFPQCVTLPVAYQTGPPSATYAGQQSSFGALLAS